MSKQINRALRNRKYVRQFDVHGSSETFDLSRLSLFIVSKAIDSRREEHQPREKFLEGRHGDLRYGK